MVYPNGLMRGDVALPSPSITPVGAATRRPTSAGFGSNQDLPSIATNFFLHWTFDSDHPDANPPHVGFTGVGVDIGDGP